MHQDEYLYSKLIEECAEVQQRVCKLLLFGPDERQETAPTNLRGASVPPGTNAERLAGEVCDLQIIIHLLGFKPPTSEEVVAKRLKLEKYLNYAISLGRVEVDLFSMLKK
jgi:hypothetical protein